MSLLEYSTLSFLEELLLLGENKNNNFKKVSSKPHTRFL